VVSAYSTHQRDKLFQLLPAYLRSLDGPDRRNDSDPPGPLQALLRVIEEAADAVDADIEQLLHDAFIETCEPWVVPYIGDLVGTTPLFDESRVRDAETAAEVFADLTGPSFLPTIGLGARADVAKTIHYRRRKGTLPMLEELARDVTGWPAHAVAFFGQLAWTQWVRNHVRPHVVATPDLRRVEPLDRLGGAFDPHVRTIDVRPIGRLEGWYGVRKLGLLLWRLRAHRFVSVDARAAGGPGNHRFHASPLGQDAPLFSARRRESDETGLARREHVPQAISRALFHADLQAALGAAPVPDFTQYYGLFAPSAGMVMAEGRSLLVALNGVPVPPARIRCRNLEGWAQPAGNLVAIDVATGRISLGPAVAGQRVTVSFHAGFPGDLGGGPYRRGAWLTARLAPMARSPARLPPGWRRDSPTASSGWATAAPMQRQSRSNRRTDGSFRSRLKTGFGRTCDLPSRCGSTAIMTRRR
jgi:hypothetical protein